MSATSGVLEGTKKKSHKPGSGENLGEARGKGVVILEEAV